MGTRSKVRTRRSRAPTLSLSILTRLFSKKRVRHHRRSLTPFLEIEIKVFGDEADDETAFFEIPFAVYRQN